MTDPAVDRIAPTHRPDRRPAGWQRWRELLFVHWPIPVEALRPLIPERLHIDTFDGVAYIGVVPFAMEGVQPWWVPFGMDFLETNLRTYVHINGEPGCGSSRWTRPPGWRCRPRGSAGACPTTPPTCA